MNAGILTHPNIPKPLHGMNPRSIMGDAWWNKTRQEVYAKTDYHCYACGVHKSQAKKHQWLEAHEFWDINYTTGVCKVIDIVPLCHYCHNFIHSGYLCTKYQNRDISRSEIVEILEHGFKILAENNLECFVGTFELACRLGINAFGVLPYDLPTKQLAWTDYILEWNGQTYKSKFANYNEWMEHYNG